MLSTGSVDVLLFTCFPLRAKQARLCEINKKKNFSTYEREKHILRTVYLRHTDKVNKKIITTEACKYDEHPCFNLIFLCFVSLFCVSLEMI